MKHFNFLLGALCPVILLVCESAANENLSVAADVRASSVYSTSGYEPSLAVDGDVSDASRWVSRAGSYEPEWLELHFSSEQHLGGVHLYSGYQSRDAIPAFDLQYFSEGQWQSIPSAKVENNRANVLRIPFDAAVEVVTDKLRLYVENPEGQPVRVKELKVWAYNPDGIPNFGESLESSGEPPLIYLNQSGFNLGQPKRFTAPLLDDGTAFEITEKGADEVLFSGQIDQHIGDFTEFNPESNVEYVLHAGEESSVPFRVGHWWLERISYQNTVNFMVDSRHYVGNHTDLCVGSFAWRDDHHFAFELNTLVPMLLSNPDAYLRMPSQVSYVSPEERPGKWGALEPYEEAAPDIVKLIHWGADVIVTQRLKHMMLKEQLAFFLYAWPVLSEWLPEQNYAIVKAYAMESWAETEIHRDYRYDETTENHNLFEVKKTVGSTKGGNPPGHSLLPNLLMYQVALRDGDAGAEKFFESAYAQTDWLIQNLDWQDPLSTKGQRMSEHVTMTALVTMLEMYPERAPEGLKAKINAWAEVMIERSSNLWDFRKLSDDQWVPTGEQATHWNEPGNVMGFPASLLAAMPHIESEVARARLNELVWSHFDNIFGRNPTGRHFSYDAPREIEGVERGWYSYHHGGIGQLAEARFVLDGAPKNQHYPYHPEVGNIGWSEGWVSFNTAYNLSMSYLARVETELQAYYDAGELEVRLKAPINFDYEQVETAQVRVQFEDGSEQSVTVRETSVNSPYLMAQTKVPTKPVSIVYGYGYMEVRAPVN